MSATPKPTSNFNVIITFSGCFTKFITKTMNKTTKSLMDIVKPKDVKFG